MPVYPRRVTRADGAVFGAQSERGVPVSRDGRPITSVMGSTLVIDNGALTDEFEIPFHPGYGTIQFELVGTVAGSSIVVAGQDADGNAITETLDTNANDDVTTSNSYVSDPAPVATPAGFTNENVDVTAHTVARVLAGMYDRLFKLTNNSLNEQADVVESDQDYEQDEQGKLGGAADLSMRIPSSVDLHYVLRGMFNPLNVLSTAVATQSPAAAVSVPGDGALSDFLPVTGTPPVAVLDRPSKAKITFGAAPGAGTLTITGYIPIGAAESNRRQRKEVITLGAETEYESVNYYTAYNMTIVAAGVATPGNATFVWDPELYATVQEISPTDPQFPGFTIQDITGGVPFVGKNYIPSEMTLEATSTGITVQFTGPVGEVSRRRTIRGGDTEVLAPDKTYTRVSTRRFAGWAGALKFDGDIIKSTGVTVNFNRNYTPDDAFDGDRFRSDIEGGTVRITVATTTRFRSGDAATDMFIRWDEVFRDNILSALEFAMFDYTPQGQEYEMEIAFPAAQLNEAPQLTAGTGSIDEPLAFLAVQNAAGDSPIKVTTWTKEQYVE